MQACGGKDMGHGTVAVCKKCLAEWGGVAILLCRKTHEDTFVNEDMVKVGDRRMLNAMAELALCEYLPASILTSATLLERGHWLRVARDAFQGLVERMIIPIRAVICRARRSRCSCGSAVLGYDAAPEPGLDRAAAARVAAGAPRDVGVPLEKGMVQRQRMMCAGRAARVCRWMGFNTKSRGPCSASVLTCCPSPAGGVIERLSLLDCDWVYLILCFGLPLCCYIEYISILFHLIV
jgi:hypothetical protein